MVDSWRWSRFAALIAVLPLVWSTAAEAQAASALPPTSALLDDARAKLHATFKSFQFEKMQDSDIPGIVEIYTNGRIIYYAPAQEILIMGEMWSANGVSLTEDRISQFAGEKAKDIDRSVALVVGNGDQEIIEFVDPDCGHCRAAHKWFSEPPRSNVKHLIYFMPLKGRAQAEARVVELLCAAPGERAAALEKVFNPKGPLDLQKAIRCREGIEQLAAQARVAQSIGVYATPFYVIDGKVTAGFSADRMVELLRAVPGEVSQIGR